MPTLPRLPASIQTGRQAGWPAGTGSVNSTFASWMFLVPRAVDLYSCCLGPSCLPGLLAQPGWPSMLEPCRKQQEGAGARAPGGSGLGTWDMGPAETSLSSPLHAGTGSILSPDSASGPPSQDLLCSPLRVTAWVPRLAVTLTHQSPLAACDVSLRIASSVLSGGNAEHTVSLFGLSSQAWPSEGWKPLPNPPLPALVPEDSRHG